VTLLSLSPDQARACETIRTWVRDRCDTWREGVPGEILKLAGYAGCGKTTVLGVLAKELEDEGILVAYATFTGRASTILSRKLTDQGVVTANRLKASNPRALEGKFAKFFLNEGEERMAFCGTLHRLLYAPMINENTDELLGWRTRQTLDRRYGLIVVDEASMVGDTMLADIRRHGVPILAVGDHGQLSPVKDVGSLMKDPDIRLEKIHRQAEGNPIIQLSKVIRETGRLDRSLGSTALEAKIKFGTRAQLGDAFRLALRGIDSGVPSERILDVGALCWTNKTRITTNRIIRKALSYVGAPKGGEALMCLRNNNDAEISNGMRGVLQRDGDQLGYKLDVELSFPYEEVHGDFELCGYQFNREKTFANVEELQRMVPGLKRMSEAGLLFDFGYCATVHKFQGSSLKHAIGVLDRPANPGDSEYRRWLYTLVTRASERLTLLT